MRAPALFHFADSTALSTAPRAKSRRCASSFTSSATYSHLLNTVAAHGLDVAENLEAFACGIDDKGAVACLRNTCLGIGAGNDNREIRALRARREPLVTVDDPVIAILDGDGASGASLGAPARGVALAIRDR